jgi:SOUL heme-binding protein
MYPRRTSIVWSCQIVIYLFFFLTKAAMAVEEAPYRVLVSEPPFEQRHYPSFVVAETELPGDFDSASRTGFRRVAAYIFGENSSDAGSSRKIAMTAPVTVTPIPSGWRLHFVMPSQEKLDTLPKPNNSQVAIRRVADHEMVSIRFSGWATASAIKENTDRLTEWALSRKLTLVSTPQVARYNDPFTLPWRRRNEILIEVAAEAPNK